MKTIAIVDDDVAIGDLLDELLQKSGYRTRRAWSGTEALYMLSQGPKPDLVLLDLMLPGLGGEELLPRLKGIPVIVLSARGESQDKVSLLLAGAADYVTKPFNTQELLARIAVQLRRGAGETADEVLSAGALRLDAQNLEATVGERTVKLTRTEAAILKLLLQNPGQVFSKGRLLDRISLDTPDCTERSLKQHISNLRQKLREAGGGDCIETVWGIGFKLDPPES